MVLVEASLREIPPFLQFCRQDSIIKVRMYIGERICIHDTHVKNTVHKFMPEVLDQNIILILGFHHLRWGISGMG